jgi:hypothetical protein
MRRWDSWRRTAIRNAFGSAITTTSFFPPRDGGVEQIALQ